MIRQEYKNQVNLLLAVIPEVSKEKCFALHGGTAINLFIRNMPRLSVDIDLTYVPIEEREVSVRKINEALILDLKEFFQKSSNIEILGPISSFKECREILKTDSDLSLAILDISLEDGEDSGIKIAKLISSVNNVPTIFMSGLPREKGFEVAKYAKPFSYLKKPYSKQDLWDSLELAIQYDHKSENWNHKNNKPENRILYLKTSPGEITPVKIIDIILIEADDKILNIFTENPFKKIVIGSPGLKNFYQDKLQHFRDFAQVNKKYVVNSSKIRLIKDNHLHMLPAEIDHTTLIPKGFPKPIPLPSDVNIRNMILKELGIK